MTRNDKCRFLFKLRFNMLLENRFCCAIAKGDAFRLTHCYNPCQCYRLPAQFLRPSGIFLPEVLTNYKNTHFTFPHTSCIPSHLIVILTEGYKALGLSICNCLHLLRVLLSLRPHQVAVGSPHFPVKKQSYIENTNSIGC